MLLAGDNIDTEKAKLIDIAKKKNDLKDSQVLKQSYKIDKLIIEDLKRQLRKQRQE